MTGNSYPVSQYKKIYIGKGHFSREFSYQCAHPQINLQKSMEYFLAAKFYELFYDGFKPDTVVRVQCATASSCHAGPVASVYHVPYCRDWYFVL